MPTWQPDWTDVAFDHQAAAVAVEATEALAAALRRALARRPPLLERARTDWSGPSRIGFDRVVGQLTAEERQLEATLRALARGIAHAAEDATSLQARRVADRQRWQQEADAEAAAQAAPRTPPG